MVPELYHAPELVALWQKLLQPLKKRSKPTYTQALALTPRCELVDVFVQPTIYGKPT